MRDDVCLREIARCAKPLRKLAEKSKVQIHAAIAGAIERSGGRLREAARRFDRVSEQHDPRASIATTEEPLPRVLYVVCDRIDEIHEALFGGRRAQSTGGSNALAGRGIAAAEKRKKILPGDRAQKQQ